MTGSDSAEALQELAIDQSDSVELVVTWYQTWLNSTTIAPDPQKSETEADIAAFVVDARKAGLKIHLKPHVDCLCGTWRAKIGTQFTTEAQWSAWFASYNQYMASMTAIAVKYRFDSFNVGTEMIGVSGRESDWRTVVRRVRAVYSGPLLYGANWGDEPWQVQWWDAVDFIGKWVIQTTSGEGVVVLLCSCVPQWLFQTVAAFKSIRAPHTSHVIAPSLLLRVPMCHLQQEWMPIIPWPTPQTPPWPRCARTGCP